MILFPKRLKPIMIVKPKHYNMHLIEQFICLYVNVVNVYNDCSSSHIFYYSLVARLKLDRHCVCTYIIFGHTFNILHVRYGLVAGCARTTLRRCYVITRKVRKIGKLF